MNIGQILLLKSKRLNDKVDITINNEFYRTTNLPYEYRMKKIESISLQDIIPSFTHFVIQLRDTIDDSFKVSNPTVYDLLRILSSNIRVRIEPSRTYENIIQCPQDENILNCYIRGIAFGKPDEHSIKIFI